MAYQVVLYRSSAKIREVEAFLDELNERQRVKVLRQVSYLVEFGLTAANPGLKKVSSTVLWEVRILGKDNIRLICVEVKRIVYVLHVFFKKKQKTPAREFRIATQRYHRLID